MGIDKQSNSGNVLNRSLQKRDFWVAVIFATSMIIGSTILYFPYQSQEQHLVNLKTDQGKHSTFQASIRAEINNQKRSDFVAQLQENSPSNRFGSGPNELLASSETSSKVTSNQIASNPINPKTFNNSNQKALFNSKSELPSFSESPKQDRFSLDKMSFSMAGFSSKLSEDLSSNKFETPNSNSEFTKKNFCQQLKWYAGLSGGLDHFANERNYSDEVDKQLTLLHYNLENSELLSTQYKGNKQFNIGVNGGVQLFNKLEIEGGLVYHQSNMEFTSIYQNVLKEEYTYIEWVPTGESGGPNGQPIYRPQNVLDHYYVSNRDTLLTQANNYQLEVPLLVRYNFRFNKLAVYASLGSSAIVYSKYRVKTSNISSGESIETSNEQFGAIQINALFGAGLSYQIFKNIEFKIEPLFRPVIMSKDEFMPSFNSNSTSLNAGLTYRF